MENSVAIQLTTEKTLAATKGASFRLAINLAGHSFMQSFIGALIESLDSFPALHT